VDRQVNELSESEKRMLQMFYITVWQTAAEDWQDEKVLANMNALSGSPVMLAELIELLQYNYNRIDFIDEPVALGFDSPLDLHCKYSRDQLLVAMDFLTPSNVREGVKWLPDKQVDILFVTLNKSDKDCLLRVTRSAHGHTCHTHSRCRVEQSHDRPVIDSFFFSTWCFLHKKWSPFGSFESLISSYLPLYLSFWFRLFLNNLDILLYGCDQLCHLVIGLGHQIIDHLFQQGFINRKSHMFLHQISLELANSGISVVSRL
jgi:hypothetical protein